MWLLYVTKLNVLGKCETKQLVERPVVFKVVCKIKANSTVFIKIKISFLTIC